MTGQNSILINFFLIHKYCKNIWYLSVSSTKKYDLGPMRAVNNLLFERLHSHSYMFPCYQMVKQILSA